MKSKITFISLVYFSFFSFAELNAITRYPYSKKPLEYLNNRDVILYAIKVSGNIGPTEYIETLKESNNLRSTKFQAKWKEVTPKIKEQYIVIKSIKGGIDLTGEIISFPNQRLMGGTRTGESYIIFLSQHGSEYEITPCDFANVTHLNLDEMNELLSLDRNQLIKRLYDEYFLICRRDREIE